MRRRALLALLLPAPALAQGAAPPALLRPTVLLEGEALRLEDIWDNAGPRAATVLAAAPLPGRRMILETANLVNLARQYGVNWRPMTGNERVVIERPGRAIPRAEVEALLRDELHRLGLDTESEVELPGFVAPLVPATAMFQLAIEGAVLEQPGLRFAATLAVMADGMPTQRLRIAGRAAPTVPVVVATRRLALGEVVGPADARAVRMRAERVRPGMAERLDQVVGQEIRRPLAVEQGFALVDLGPPSVVQKNALVTLILDAPGLQLAVQGRALEAAPRGGAVPVMNLSSRTVVEGVAIGPNRVRVAMGAVPRQGS